MDLTKLRYFIALAETEHLRKAAEILGISAPALSKSIKLLEEEMNEVLFQPSGRGIKITKRGRELAQNAKPLVDAIFSLRDGIRTSHEIEPYRIGSFEVFTTYFLGILARSELKSIPLSLFELLPGEIESHLAKNIIDLGITFLPVPHQDIEHLKIGEINLNVFGVKENFQGKSFKALPFVIPLQPIQGAPTKVRGLDGWPDDRVFRKIQYRVALMESALELCRQGEAVGYFPSFVVALHNAQKKKEYQLCAIPNPLSIKERKQAVYLVKRKIDLEDSMSKKIAKTVRMAIKE